jgi:hypothetical protein
MKMFWTLLEIIAISFMGGFLVFPIVILLSKIGYFEPLELEALKKFESTLPRYQNSSSLYLEKFPINQKAFASVVTIALTGGLHINIENVRISPVATSSTGTIFYKGSV